MNKNRIDYKRVLLSILFLTSALALSTAQDTMYVYRAGGVITKVAINNIDTVVFYEPAQEIHLPELTTAAVASITETTAVCGGEILSDGGTDIIAKGICWSIEVNPDTSDYKTMDGTGTGTFISNLTGLTAYKTYYVRAYAINAQGISYGEEKKFTTLSPVGLVQFRMDTAKNMVLSAVSATTYDWLQMATIPLCRIMI